MEKKLMVSVDMITYKHEAFIKEAIEGVLMQETNFLFDLIIADDCSPDKTPEIVKDIIKTHPNGFKIKYFRQQKNIGMQANGVFAINQCKGKYIAICEGDDYWTDPYKLQKQVDFLEANEDYGMVCTDILKYKQITGQFIESNIAPFNGWIYEERFKETNEIWTVTVCFRKELLLNLPILDSSKYFTGDIFLYFHFSLLSKIKFINEKTAVYRILEESASHFKSQFKAIEFAYKVANTTLYYLKEHPITTNLHRKVFYNKMLVIFKYAVVTKDFSLFKTVLLRLPSKPSIKNILIQVLYLLSKRKTFFNLYTSCVKIK